MKSEGGYKPQLSRQVCFSDKIPTPPGCKQWLCLRSGSCLGRTWKSRLSWTAKSERLKLLRSLLELRPKLYLFHKGWTRFRNLVLPWRMFSSAWTGSCSPYSEFLVLIRWNWPCPSPWEPTVCGASPPWGSSQGHTHPAPSDANSTSHPEDRRAFWNLKPLFCVCSAFPS